MLSYSLSQWTLGVTIIVGPVFVFSLVASSENGTFPDRRSPKSKPEYSFPTPILLYDLYEKYEYHMAIRRRDYGWPNHPIIALGVEKFLSYAAHFCRYETQDGALEVVSVGSGSGVIENDIIAVYKDHFGGRLNITLIDAAEDCSDKVHFRKVKDLIEERPHVVRNCVLLIIWPDRHAVSDGYDIDAIRKLQPNTVLVVYEITGVSGSDDLKKFLHSRKRKPFHYRDSYEYPRNDLELDKYAKEEVDYVEVNLPKSTFTDGFSSLHMQLRMVKLKRTV